MSDETRDVKRKAAADMDNAFAEPAHDKCCCSNWMPNELTADSKYFRTSYVREKVVGNENEWMLLEYPMLEHIELLDDGYVENNRTMVELRPFLKINPNVQRFGIFSINLKEILQSLLDSNIQLNQLDIAVNCLLTEMNDCLDLLNQLHAQGFYKRLHFYARFLYNPDEIHRITAVCGLEKLYLAVVMTEPRLRQLPQLKELCIHMEEDDLGKYSFEAVAKDLMNVERVYLFVVSSDNLIQFIRHAPRIKEIKVESLVEGTHFKRGVIDVLALNRERKQLTGARKIILYVDDCIYDATKRVAVTTKLKMIDLKSADSVEWNHALFY